MLVEQRNDATDQVVEIDGVIRPQRRFVAAKDADRDDRARVLEIRVPLDSIRRQQRVLPQGNLRLQTFRVAWLAAGGQVLEDAPHIIGRQDGKSRTQADDGSFLAQDLQTERVERRHDQASGCPCFEQRSDPLPHLARCLVGEGQRSDLACVEARVVHEMSNLVRDHTGLAANRRLQAPNTGLRDRRPPRVADGSRNQMQTSSTQFLHRPGATPIRLLTHVAPTQRADEKQDAASPVYAIGVVAGGSEIGGGVSGGTSTGSGTSLGGGSEIGEGPGAGVGPGIGGVKGSGSGVM